MTIRGIHSCAPEPVSTINITQNIVEMDGTVAFWVETYLSGTEYNSATYVALEYVPYARSQVTVMLNSGVMRQGLDFSVDSDRVTLLFTPDATDKIHVRYFALTDGTSAMLADSTMSEGMMVGFSGSVAPDGWLLMDGSTDHLISAYGALNTWLLANPDYEDVGDRTATTFRLKLINTPYYNGTTLVTGTTIIKT